MQNLTNKISSGINKTKDAVTNNVVTNKAKDLVGTSKQQNVVNQNSNWMSNDSNNQNNHLQSNLVDNNVNQRSLAKNHQHLEEHHKTHNHGLLTSEVDHQHGDHYHSKINNSVLEGDLLKSNLRFETDRNRVQAIPLSAQPDLPDIQEQELNQNQIFSQNYTDVPLTQSMAKPRVPPIPIQTSNVSLSNQYKDLYDSPRNFFNNKQEVKNTIVHHQPQVVTQQSSVIRQQPTVIRQQVVRQEPSCISQLPQNLVNSTSQKRFGINQGSLDASQRQEISLLKQQLSQKELEINRLKSQQYLNDKFHLLDQKNKKIRELKNENQHLRKSIGNLGVNQDNVYHINRTNTFTQNQPSIVSSYQVRNDFEAPKSSMNTFARNSHVYTTQQQPLRRSTMRRSSLGRRRVKCQDYHTQQDLDRIITHVDGNHQVQRTFHSSRMI